MARRELPYTHSYATNETGKSHCFGVVYTPPESAYNLPDSHKGILAVKNIRSRTYTPTQDSLRFQYTSVDVNAPVAVKYPDFYLRYCLNCYQRTTLECLAHVRDRHTRGCPITDNQAVELIPSVIHYPHHEAVVPCNARSLPYNRVRLTTPILVDSVNRRIVSVGLSNSNTRSSGQIQGYSNTTSPADLARLWGNTHLKHLDRLVSAALRLNLTAHSTSISSPSGDTYHDLCNIDQVYNPSTIFDRSLDSGRYVFTSYSPQYSYKAPDNKPITRVYVNATNGRTNQVYADCDGVFTELLSNQYYDKKLFKMKKCALYS